MGMNCGNGPLVVAVLAAGRARRFGRPKLAEPLGGKPLLAWAVEAALAADPHRVLVVLGPESVGDTLPAGTAEWDTGKGGVDLRPALPNDPRLEVLVNPHPQRGLASSLGLVARRAAEMEAGVLVMLLGDMPLVQPATIAQVARAALDSPAGAAAAELEGRPGHPVAFSRRHFPRLAGLEGDQGGRVILAELGPEVVLVPAPPQSALDVDRPADLERIRRWLTPA